jgi:hypothetical protein
VHFHREWGRQQADYSLSIDLIYQFQTTCHFYPNLGPAF